MFAMALPSNSKTRLERVAEGKPSSLMCLAVSDKGKKFDNIDNRCQYVIKLCTALSFHNKLERLSLASLSNLV